MKDLIVVVIIVWFLGTILQGCASKQDKGYCLEYRIEKGYCLIPSPGTSRIYARCETLKCKRR